MGGRVRPGQEPLRLHTHVLLVGHRDGHDPRVRRRPHPNDPAGEARGGHHHGLEPLRACPAYRRHRGQLQRCLERVRRDEGAGGAKPQAGGDSAAACPGLGRPATSQQATRSGDLARHAAALWGARRFPGGVPRGGALQAGPLPPGGSQEEAPAAAARSERPEGPAERQRLPHLRVQLGSAGQERAGRPDEGQPGGHGGECAGHRGRRLEHLRHDEPLLQRRRLPPLAGEGRDPLTSDPAHGNDPGHDLPAVGSDRLLRLLLDPGGLKARAGRGHAAHVRE
mmetsp:Transcript_150606/g.419812  ORF Transcript_150606/g.419812 Transcript_150606/m.419812 type:complete len:281 (+) Transcript_150606:1067-1909(+)